MRKWRLSCLLILAGCTGPTVYLGRAPQVDAGPDAGAAPDAGDGDDDEGEGDDDDDDEDDDLIECVDDSFCDEGTPHCHPSRELCVECLEDDHCDRQEHCTRGICRDN